MKLEERAFLAWPVLCYAATSRRTMEYTTLAKLTGMVQSGLGPMLEFIHAYCLAKGLPALSVLVVQTKTGRPGVGFTAAEDILAETAKVFNHSWLTTAVPTPEALLAVTKPEATDLTPARKRLVDYLYSNPGQTAKEIATALYPQAPYQQQVNGELNGLINQCLVCRSKTDGAFRYWLSHEGARLTGQRD